MLALEFARDISRIRNELKINDLVALIFPWVNPATPVQIDEAQKNRLSQLLFASSSAYERLMMLPDTRKLLESMSIGEFYEPFRLRTMLSTISAITTSQQLTSAPLLAPFITFLEQFRAFQKMDNAANSLLAKEKIGQVNPSEQVLELELIEYADETGISPQRIQIFVSSVTQLHKNLTIIHGIRSDRLTFKYFDSGSSFLVGIQGAKAVIESLSVLLNQWWERIRFWRYDTYEKKISSVSKSLTIIGEIHEAVEKKTITAEEGEILKVGIFREVDKLTGIGAMVPLDAQAQVDQRQLLTEMRNTKLLGDGSQDAAVTEPEAQPTRPE
jgi:hypothetical protein